MPTSPSNKLTVALSMGDPAGIGPEIIVQSLTKPAMRKIADFIVVGDANVLNEAERRTGCSVFAGRRAVRVIDRENVPQKTFVFGREKAAYGKAAMDYIITAHELVQSGEADCLVTAPINKSAIKKAGWRFPGHTEFLANLAGIEKFVMMLAGETLRVSLVTRHLPLREVSKHLSVAKIVDTITITVDSLRKDFHISNPRIGVCALNPHAGEDGIFGKEEAEIVRPAVSRFKKKRIVGPLPADAVFYDAFRKKFDAVVCLYHDQGLIPLKMIDRNSGVNITLGLPFVRTSPDHGTAFEIAGKAAADPRSCEAAIRTAVSMTLNRRAHAVKKRY